MGGIGYARNIEVKYAEEKWLLFCDADDSFSPGAFSIMDSFVGSDARLCILYPRLIVMVTGPVYPLMIG